MEKVKSIQFNREWQGPKGMVYYFNIEFYNGDKGQFSSAKKEQTKFEIDKEYSVTKEKKTNKNGDYFFFNIDKPAFVPGGNNSGGPKEDYWSKSEVVLTVSTNHSLEYAIKYLSQSEDHSKHVKGDSVYKVANKLVSWYYEGSDKIDDKKLKSEYILRRRQALEKAVLAQSMPCEKRSTIGEVLAFAEEIIAYIETKEASL